MFDYSCFRNWAFKVKRIFAGQMTAAPDFANIRFERCQAVYRAKQIMTYHDRNQRAAAPAGLSCPSIGDRPMIEWPFDTAEIEALILRLLTNKFVISSNRKQKGQLVAF